MFAAKRENAAQKKMQSLQRNEKFIETNIIKNFKKKYQRCSAEGQLNLNHVSTQGFQDSSFLFVAIRRVARILQMRGDVSGVSGLIPQPPEARGSGG